MFRKTKSLIGLDLGSSVVKAVEISLEGQDPVITGFGRAELPPEGDINEAVAAVFEQGNFKSKKVVTSVSGQSVVVRYIPMTRMSNSDLKEAIRFESDKYLPFEQDEVVMDCQPLLRRPGGGSADFDESSDDQMTVLLAACRTGEIDQQVALVESHGLSPVAIDVDLFAIANAWDLCGIPQEEYENAHDMASALVDVGATRTSINVLCGGETCFSREINIGGADMTQAIARRLGIDLFEAETVKRAPESHEVEVNSAITPVLEDLVSEISLSLDYVEHHEGIRVEEILLSGGGVLAPGATAYIEQATARTARTWNPLEGLRVDVNEVNVEELEAWAPSLVVAVGLASRVRSL
jgi:type IV pilus assembly protein PilM